MDRRTLLATGAGLATALAGCQSLGSRIGSSGPLEPGEEARGPMEDDPSAEWRATISSTTVQTSAYVNSGRDDRHRSAETHYLFAAVDGSLPPDYYGSYTIPYDLPGTFTAVVDGVELEPTGEPFRPDESVGAFSGYVFEVDAREPVSDARIRWDVGSRTHEWLVPERTVEQFQRRPRAGSLELSVPENVLDGETVPVELSVENVGDDGRIRAGLYREHRRDMRRFSAYVPAGERHRWTIDLQADAQGLGRQDWTFYAVTGSGEQRTDTVRIWHESLVE